MNRSSIIQLMLLAGTNAVCGWRDAMSEESAQAMENKARVYTPGERRQISSSPLPLRPGAHLFIDDYLIERSENLTRCVNVPSRDPAIPNPLVTGKEDGCFQPYLTVLRDERTGRFRLWYGRRTDDFNTSRSRIGYMESTDGVHWQRPHRVLADPAPIQFGVSIIDEGPHCPNPAQRFKYGWYAEGGLKVAASPDGFTWTPLAPGVVAPHNHDINGIHWDPLRKRYVATLSFYIEGDTWRGRRRVTTHAVSADLLHWSQPWFVLTPHDGEDEGETQFYAMDGYLTRGDLLIGMVKVLRDDLKADAPPSAYGIGYTTLAWTRDGETWVRDREKFFDRHPTKGAWDHAHAWIDEQVPVGDEVYLYYGGYARGHKVERFTERQIGLVRMKRDRYVSRDAGSERGTLRTPLVTLDAARMTVSAKVAGELRVRLLEADGKPVRGFDWRDSAPICGDALAHPVGWKKPLTALRGKPVRIEFSLRYGQLFGFELIR